MREGIHPNYVEATVSCACGYIFKTRSTKPVIKLDICSHCHPFFTGKQKLVDTAGRVERFRKKFKEIKITPRAKKKKLKVTKKKQAVKILTTTPVRKRTRPSSLSSS